MGYKTILLALQGLERAADEIRFAGALADEAGAKLLAGHVRPTPAMGVGYGEAPFADAGFIESQREEAGTAEAKLRRVWIGLRGPAAGAAFLCAEGEVAPTLAAFARGADLCLVGGEAGPVAAGVADDLIVAAGGPVLLLPPHLGTPAFATVAVGWDGSRPAARALSDALPFLQAATKVVLVTLGDAEGVGLDPARDRLAAHGVAASTLHEPNAKGRGIGAALLAIAGQGGADLLVMGAHGHGRLREMFVGSATRHVLRHAEMPVLFSA